MVDEAALYSTADIDPSAAALLYGQMSDARGVYAERTALSSTQGLAEYASDSGPGAIGVDMGPFGLDEYGGKLVGYDDGLPPQWRFAETPVRWYEPSSAKHDHYGAEGATPYTVGLFALMEPDHEPEVGESVSI
jgi:hypothetical protein